MGQHEEMLCWRRVRGPWSKDRGGAAHGQARPQTRCTSRGASGGEGKGEGTRRVRGGRWPRERVLPAAAPSCAAVAAPAWQENRENLGWVYYWGTPKVSGMASVVVTGALGPIRLHEPPVLIVVHRYSHSRHLCRSAPRCTAPHSESCPDATALQSPETSFPKSIDGIDSLRNT